MDRTGCVVPTDQRVTLDPLNELATLMCDSDLVVVGTAGTATTHMTADKDFLYSDWGFRVEELLKNNPKAPVTAGASIIVTRPAGKLQINGRMIYAICSDFQDFGTGNQHLLFLRFVPETGAYAMGGQPGSLSSLTRPLGSVTLLRPTMLNWKLWTRKPCSRVPGMLWRS